MRAYASMYRPFRPTAISGHTRLASGHTRVISGHKMAETYHAIVCVTLDASKNLLIGLTRGPKAPIHTDLTLISISIFISISISICISVFTDISRSPEAYPPTLTAYQTDLSSEAHDAGTHATVYATLNATPPISARSPDSPCA